MPPRLTKVRALTPGYIEYIVCVVFSVCRFVAGYAPPQKIQWAHEKYHSWTVLGGVIEQGLPVKTTSSS